MSVTAEQIDQLLASNPVVVHLFPESGTKLLGSFEELSKFLNAELEFWEGVYDPVARALRHAKSAVDNATLDDLNSAIERIQVARGVLSAGHAPRILLSSTPQAIFVKKLIAENRETGTAAYYYLTDAIEQLRHILTSHPIAASFDGIVRASVFRQPQIGEERIGAEVSAFERLRKEITKTAEDAATSAANLHADITTWSQETERDVNRVVEDQRREFGETNTTWTQAFADLHQDGLKKAIDLEKLYREKLRLEAPATHWETLERKYLKSGRLQMLGTFLTVAVIGSVVARVLYYPPAVWLQQTDAAGKALDQLNVAGTIKSAILVTVGISVALYIVHLLTRLATSSYHLARDARERCQLTHMYLSLMRESAMEEKDRQVVLSALFSRSDTGLLKHEGTPAMPGSLSGILDALKPR